MVAKNYKNLDINNRIMGENALNYHLNTSGKFFVMIV